jgi:hypothetical protein
MRNRQFMSDAEAAAVRRAIDAERRKDAPVAQQTKSEEDLIFLAHTIRDQLDEERKMHEEAFAKIRNELRDQTIQVLNLRIDVAELRAKQAGASPRELEAFRFAREKAADPAPDPTPEMPPPPRNEFN